jgi:hypothetical protein
MQKLKLGKLKARPGSITFRFSAYAKKLPNPPAKAGHKDLITLPWEMYGNDTHGDCVFAGAAHETTLWNKEGGNDVAFTDAAVLSDYSAVTGYDPNDPSSDQGTDMQVAASYRRKTGIQDKNGKRHKIAAYLAVTTARQLKQAIWLFGAVGIGIRFPDSAMKQFNEGKPWSVVQMSPIQGGHYIPGVSYDPRGIYVVTWGKVQMARWTFIQKYMDEAVVYLSTEMLSNGKSLEGFDLATLQADIAAL